MDKHPSLDDLFAKARQQAPVASLEETRNQLLQSIAAPAAKSKVLTSKKWIMFYSVITLVLIGSIAYFSGKPHQPENTKKNTVIHHPSLAPDSSVSTEEKPSEPAIVRKSTKITAEKTMLEVFSDLLEKPIELTVALGTQPAITKKFFQEDTTYRFPTLTDEEIATTEKQKKRMIKALSKKDKEAYAYLPSGSFDFQGKVVSVQAFYMQTTEVTNLEYRTFLFDLLIQGRKEEFIKAKPDQHQWVTEFDNGMKAMEDQYFSHPAYNNYPVVNISREGAEMYCKWLTQLYNQYAIRKKLSRINDLRIPSRTEWIYAASSGGKYTNYPWEGEFVRDRKGLFLANHHPDNGRFIDDGVFHTGYVNSYNPSEYGLYCLSGNVAEMVYNSDNARTQPGTAGGDWTSDAELLKLYAEDPYNGVTEPRTTIGFRTVMTFSGDR